MPRKKKGPILTGLILPLAVMIVSSSLARAVFTSDTVGLAVLGVMLVVWILKDSSKRIRF